MHPVSPETTLKALHFLVLVALGQRFFVEGTLGGGTPGGGA